MSEIQSPWMTRDEAAKYAGCSTQVMYSLVATGAIPSYLPLGAKPDGPRRIVFKDDVDAAIRERIVRAPYASLVAAGAVDVFAELPGGKCA